MSRLRWAESITKTFVKLYLKEQCLWDASHPSYKNKRERHKSYMKLIKTFTPVTGKPMSMHEIKTKIRNLRTTYQQQVQKIMRLSDKQYEYEPRLVWFKEMDRYMKGLEAARNPNLYNHYVSLPPDKEEIETLENHDELDEVQNELIWESGNEELLSKVASIKHEDTYEEDDTPLNQLKKLKTEKIEDEFDIFGRLIATQLRDMELNRALKIQLEIQALVNDSRIVDV